MRQGVCAIVEPRKHAALQMAVTSVLNKISDWDIVIFHGFDNQQWVYTLFENEPRVSYKSLACSNLDINEYNRLLTSSDFYKHFQGSEYVLIFQSDSMLFQSSPFQIQDFLGWDYVGAPWKDKPAANGGNGGLSLRKVAVMIHTCQKFPYPTGRALNEDVYFSRKKLSFAPRSLSSQFSVESILGQTFHFGCHKPWDSLLLHEWLTLTTRAPELLLLVFKQHLVPDDSVSRLLTKNTQHNT